MVVFGWKFGLSWLLIRKPNYVEWFLLHAFVSYLKIGVSKLSNNTTTCTIDILQGMWVGVVSQVGSLPSSRQAHTVLAHYLVVSLIWNKADGLPRDSIPRLGFTSCEWRYILIISEIDDVWKPSQLYLVNLLLLQES